MATIEQLNRDFAIDGAARFEPGHGGLPKLVINAPAGDAQIYLHGAHVSHYQPQRQAAVLFMASKSFFEPGKAIRGGVPVIFPWFGPRDGDKTAMHGLVRTRSWEVQEIGRAGDAVMAVFSIASSDQTRKIWNYDFGLRFTVTVGAQLTMELEVRNTSASEIRFEDALHTYFNVGDVRQIAIEGLSGTTYVDKNNHGPQKQVDSEKPLRFKGPTDRVYLNTPATCTIEDPVLKRRVVIAKENSMSTVVWNPWAEKITGFADMLAEDWPKFV